MLRPKKWSPLPGPQTKALESEADILLYGGAAGGGKTDLLLGAARNYRRSIIFRRIFPNLRGIIDRSREIYNPTGSHEIARQYNESLHRWRFERQFQVNFGALQYEQDKHNYQGRPFNLHGFDEITEFTESQFRFVIGWNRSARSDERCRVIATCNPPTNADGEWIIRFWAPWLDPKHPNPAQPGELRYFTTQDGKDIELPNGDPITIDGETIRPKSRTFILAKVQDNPYLMEADYVSTLQSLPEPLRSKLLYGDFQAGREDDPYQLIPTEWVQQAQARWISRTKPETPISSIGVDVARGGNDRTVLTIRRDNYFESQLCYPGSSTPDGDSVAQKVIAARGSSGGKLNVDVIGVGSSVYDILKKMYGEQIVVGMNSSNSSVARDKSGQLSFMNKRAEWWWMLREALDPLSGQELAIPDDRELLADLCATKWKISARGIQAESKDDIKERLGRSPDKGDSLVYAHAIDASSATNWLAYLDTQGKKT